MREIYESHWMVAAHVEDEEPLPVLAAIREKIQGTGAMCVFVGFNRTVAKNAFNEFQYNVFRLRYKYINQQL
jgi:hypothetical protein